jgi:hypothetical protein
MEINRLTGIVQSVNRGAYGPTPGWAIFFKDDTGAKWMLMIPGTNYRIRPGDVIEIVDEEILWMPARSDHNGQRFATMGQLHPVISRGEQTQ